MRRSLMVFLLAVYPGLVQADATDATVAFLEAQGYEIVLVERTWLGRVRIEAARSGYRREVIVNPRTGEILRDLVEPETTTNDNGQEDYSPYNPGSDPEDVASPLDDDRERERDDRDDDGPDTESDRDGPDTDSDGPDNDGPDNDGPDNDGPDNDGPDNDGPDNDSDSGSDSDSDGGDD